MFVIKRIVARKYLFSRIKASKAKLIIAFPRRGVCEIGKNWIIDEGLCMWEYALFILCAIYVAIGLLVLCSWTSFRDDKRLKNADKVLIVTAHPDDECMFFSPTIIQLCREGKDVHLLCLSTGNRYGLGNIRKNELRNSCSILGIDVSNVVIINHTNLPDDNSIWWNKRLLARLLLKYVEVWDIDTLITFDKGGVSGHRNHCAIYSAASDLASKRLFPPACCLLVLKDVCLFRKYAGIFDLPLAFLFSKQMYLSSYEDFKIGKRAMSAHRSQYVWFRQLYVNFSRYMVINNLQPFTEGNDYEISEEDLIPNSHLHIT